MTEPVPEIRVGRSVETRIPISLGGSQRVRLNHRTASGRIASNNRIDARSFGKIVEVRGDWVVVNFYEPVNGMGLYVDIEWDAIGTVLFLR